MSPMMTGRPAPTWRRILDRTRRGSPMGPGAYLWALHRISGVLLVLYFFAHSIVLAFVLGGPDAFDRLMALFENPVIHWLELGLVVLAAFHAFNGARLILLHLFPEWDQRRLGYAASGLTVLVGIGSVPLFMR